MFRVIPRYPIHTLLDHPCWVLAKEQKTNIEAKLSAKLRRPGTSDNLSVILHQPEDGYAELSHPEYKRDQGNDGAQPKGTELHGIPAVLPDRQDALWRAVKLIGQLYQPIMVLVVHNLPEIVSA